MSYTFSIKAQEKKLSRPSIESTEALPDELSIPIHPNWKFNVLATEAVGEGAMTLEKYLKSVPEDFWNVVFQCLTALYALECSRVTLNDGHDQNWWVEPLSPEKQEQDKLYIYNNKEFFIKNKHKVLCYDYDRAYTSRLGNNNHLKGTLCNSYNQCNSFEPCKDLVKLMFYIYCMLGEKDVLKKENLLELLCKNDTAKEEFKDLCSRDLGPFLFNKKGEKMDINFFSSHFYSPLEILEKMYKSDLVLRFDPAQNANYKIYVCNNTLFDTGTGEIYLDKLYIQKKHIAEQFFAKQLKISELRTEITRLNSMVTLCGNELARYGAQVVLLQQELNRINLSQPAEDMNMSD